MRAWWPWMACSTFTLACGGEPAAPAPPPAEPAPAEAAPTPSPCAEGAYRAGSGDCEPFPSLSIAPSDARIAPVRDHHVTMVIEAGGPFLYVLGGTDGWRVVHDDVQRARIGEDGALGPFEPAGELPEPRAGHCAVPLGGGRVFVAGGVLGEGRPDRSTRIAHLGAGGRLEGFEPGPELPLAVMHLTCEVHRGWVYALGGRGTKSRSTAMSARARILEDGTVGPFEDGPPLAPDRSHHASFVRGDRLYVLGGLTGDPARDPEDRRDVIAATIGEDGSLGPWEPAGELPNALSVTSAQLYRDAVYLFGGLDDGVVFSDAVRRATFEADGRLGAFVELPVRLPEGRGHVHQTPVWGSFIFSVGGKDNRGESLGTVAVGRFGPGS